MTTLSSTIFALSSGYARCGVAIIRISGANASSVVTKMTESGKLPRPRFASLRTIIDPISRENLDKGIVLWFPSPHSYTGEDCCELQVHGSKAVISAIFEALAKLKDFRPATPGEFTRRAFYRSKLDLTEIEGLSDLLVAETELQRKQALLQVEGVTSNLYQEWRNTILHNLAHIESYIDFGEEEIEDDLTVNVTLEIQKLKKAIEIYLSDSKKGERLKDGVRMAIIGAPNVGKSSLLNLLCRKQAAIVSEIPGTTRDVVETTIDIDGYPVVLVDTAGIRNESGDVIEIQGINRAYYQANLADILLIVADLTHYIKLNGLFSGQHLTLNSYLNYYINKLQLCYSDQNTRKIIILNKVDMLKPEEVSAISDLYSESKNDVKTVSCHSKEGIPDLCTSILEHLKSLCGTPSKYNLLCSQIRHRYYLEQCLLSLNSYLNLADENGDQAAFVLAAECLRSASRNIGIITGFITVEDILDKIFSQFCIGK